MKTSHPMQVYTFLAVSLALNLILTFLVQRRSENRGLRFPMWLLAVVFPLTSAALYMPAVVQGIFYKVWDAGFFFAGSFALHLLLLEFIHRFLRHPAGPEETEIGGPSRTEKWIIRAVGAAAALYSLIPGRVALWQITPPTLIVTSRSLTILQLLLVIYALYQLENTYRFSADYQRKTGRLCFISITLLGIYQLLFFSSILIFQVMPIQYAETAAVIYGVLYPVILAGFLRYRLGVEQVYIPRDAVYTSITLFLTGAAFLGVAVTIMTFRWLSLDFSYFMKFLAGFTVCFFILLAAGSGNMRKRIIRFVDSQFYSRKYDYRQQFFNLHKTIMSGENLEAAVIDLVENMKYTVTADDAFVFLLNEGDGNFYLQENREMTVRSPQQISGDDEAVRLMEGQGPADLLAEDRRGEKRLEALRCHPVIRQLRIDAVFPILNRGELLGLLGLQGGRKGPYEPEDLELIGVFASSIGDVLFKHRVLENRIARKQFESFNNIAAFVIHDIKNQAATLSLILKNAEKNISNPGFQQSMLSSVGICARNLQKLVEKLALKPQASELENRNVKTGDILRSVSENAGLDRLEGIAFTLEADEKAQASADDQTLFFVVNNLIRNALEAMAGRGSLRLKTGPTLPVPEELKNASAGGEKFFSRFSAYIMAEDSGPGMTDEYIRDRLYKPFSSTKEKGIGIGLYQCRTLMEKMGGRILCSSRPGEGTRFFLLLK